MRSPVSGDLLLSLAALSIPARSPFSVIFSLSPSGSSRIASISARMASAAPVRLSSLSSARQRPRPSRDRRRPCAGAAAPASPVLRDVTAVRPSCASSESSSSLIDSAEHAVLDRLNELPDFAFDRRELLATVRQTCAMLHPQPIQLAHVLAAEVLEQVAAHQLVAQCHENAFFHLLAADGQAIGARASRASAEAGQAVAPVHDVPAAALGALRQTREEILRASCLVEPFRIAVRRHAAHLGLPRLHLVPQLVVDDAQLRERRSSPTPRVDSAAKRVCLCPGP